MITNLSLFCTEELELELDVNARDGHSYDNNGWIYEK
jgi:hypothetical protein